MSAVYDRVCEHGRQTALLVSIESLLGWDERCLLPPAAGDYRADQMTLLAGLVHDRQTDPQLGAWLDEAAAQVDLDDPASDPGAVVRQLRRQFEKKRRLPRSLVEELTRASVLGQQAWQVARRDNDFGSFLPHLEKTIYLKRQQAEAQGYEGAPYDALLDDFEPGETTANVTRVLAALKAELVPLVAAIAASNRRPDVSLLRRHYPRGAQEAFGREAASRIGFDFQRGRLDVSAHPFCSGMGPHDCRLTTRFDEKYFPSAFFGTLHEAGHGIYEQGLRPEVYGLPPGEAVSLGIHESQSRMWENLVGRGRAFWSYFYPLAQGAFAESLAGVSLDQFYAAINDVRPSLIRVEADEATYNLHILIRFELEQALISGDLPPGDAPEAWDAKYREYLGIASPTAADGVLQDIHWSAGLVGYFPTYSLGNLYAAQFYQHADREFGGGLAKLFAAGDFEPLRKWLGEKIHEQGQRRTASQLVEWVTGEPLGHRPLMTHLRDKFAPLYGL